jgi:threonine dehydratase
MLELPTADDIAAAVERLKDHVRRTPTVTVGAGALGADPSIDLVLKLESLQHAGSFKARGSFNSALATSLPAGGLIAASGGNHGIAVAHVARALGVPAEIFVPAISAPVKIERIRQRGAKVHVIEGVYDDAQRACDLRQSETGAFSIHPFDAMLTLAGQATMGVELTEQAPELDTVIVAVGGGGLAAGLALSLPADVRIICVEPESSQCLRAALDAGERTLVDVGGVAADSLGARTVGDLAFRVLEGRVESVLVSDDAIMEARQRLWSEVGVVAETGGATALAALTSGAFVPPSESALGVIVCGSNTDPSDLSS